MKNREATVLIVDDSLIIRKYLNEVLRTIDGITVLRSSPNGRDAVKQILLNEPDVVILDIEMPLMNGIEVLEYLQTHEVNKKPLILMHSSLMSKNSQHTFEALSKGASDFIKKYEGNIKDNLDNLRTELSMKIFHMLDAMSHKTVTPPPLRAYNAQRPSPSAPRTTKPPTDALTRHRVLEQKASRPEIIAIGASTGGPAAFRSMLRALPKPLPVPMVLAQHMPEGFTKAFAENLEHDFQRPVKELQEGDTLHKETIYICPCGVHARFRRSGSGLVTYVEDHKRYSQFYFRPSVDIFLDSLHELYGQHMLAVILSGMGEDGAQVLPKLRKAQVLTVVQDELSSVVWGMPGACVSNAGADLILNPEGISALIQNLVEKE